MYCGLLRIYQAKVILYAVPFSFWHPLPQRLQSEILCSGLLMPVLSASVEEYVEKHLDVKKAGKK